MPLELLIRGGHVHDGTGRAPVIADVAIADGRIRSIGRVEGTAQTEIDANGLIVAPGFIDIHSHSDYTLLMDPRAMSAIAQGVTTEVIGNCGFGCAPIGDARLAAGAIYGFDASIPLTWHGVGEYLAKLQSVSPAVNVITLVPNGQLRLASVGLVDRAASDGEIAKMRTLLREGLAEGAIGYSIGLEYPAEVGCAHEELVALASETGRAGGFFAAHTRNRAEGAPAAAVMEAIRIARKAGVRIAGQSSHAAFWGRRKPALPGRGGGSPCRGPGHRLRHAYAPVRHDDAEHAVAPVVSRAGHRRIAPASSTLYEPRSRSNT